MFGWSINLFRIAGIRLAMHWSFLLLLGWAAWEGFQLGGWSAMGLTVGYILLLFSCVVLHELGHCFAAQRFGVWVRRILLLPIGGMAEFDQIPRRPKQEIAIALAGPLVNVTLIGLLLAAGVRFPAGWMMEPLPTSAAELGRHLIILNAVMGGFNLIPVFPMDGGRVLRALLSVRFSYTRATRMAATVAKVLAIPGCLVMLFAPETPYWMGVLLFAFIILAGEAEYRVIRRREREEEHWQRLLAQFYVAPPRVVVIEPSRSRDT